MTALTEHERAFQNAFNETDAKLSRIEGISIALDDLVAEHFSTSERHSLALVALVGTLNDTIKTSFDLRSVEYRAGLALASRAEGAPSPQ